MSSLKTDLGETTRMSDFYRESLHHPEIGRLTSSVSTELEKEQPVKGIFEKNCITLSMTVACLLQLLN